MIIFMEDLKCIYVLYGQAFLAWIFNHCWWIYRQLATLPVTLQRLDPWCPILWPCLAPTFSLPNLSPISIPQYLGLLIPSRSALVFLSRIPCPCSNLNLFTHFHSLLSHYSLLPTLPTISLSIQLHFPPSQIQFLFFLPPHIFVPTGTQY